MALGKLLVETSDTASEKIWNDAWIYQAAPEKFKRWHKQSFPNTEIALLNHNPSLGPQLALAFNRCP